MVLKTDLLGTGLFCYKGNSFWITPFTHFKAYVFDNFHQRSLPFAWLLGHFLSEKYDTTVRKYVNGTDSTEVEYGDRRYPLCSLRFVILIKSGVKIFYYPSITDVWCYEKHKYFWDLKNFIFLNFYPESLPSWWEWPIIKQIIRIVHQ